MTKMHTEMTRAPLTVLLHNLRSAYNTGSIFRTADAMHIERVLVSGFTPDPTHPKVRKTALGAEQSVPWARVEDPVVEMAKMRDRGYTIASLECAPNSIGLKALQNVHFPMLLIAGNEVDGVPAEYLQASDLVFEIVQHGLKESLNVSVAAGIAMHAISQFHMSHNLPNS